MDGDQVAEAHGPQDLLLAGAHQLAVAPHGNGSGDALIAGAGADDHRHFAAVHAGVRPGGGPCTGLGLDIVAALKEGGADVGAPAVAQALLGDGGVAGDLPADNRFDAV